MWLAEGFSTLYDRNEKMGAREGGIVRYLGSWHYGGEQFQLFK